MAKPKKTTTKPAPKRKKKPAARPARATKKPNLEEILAFWVPIVRVQDWEITIRYQRHMDEGDAARVNYALAYKKAVISVRDPIDWDSHEPQDFDESVVHELVHLHFAPFKTKGGTALGIAEEQAVTSIARGFVALYRAKLVAA